ncbi:MAG TPA: TIM barrel protein [Verrucomicrobiae bacterium]|nr:TIM barrel protein [Verrucomicrobiae bacterium]
MRSDHAQLTHHAWLRGGVAAIAAVALSLGASDATAVPARRPFFAFDNAAKDTAHPDTTSQIALLKELGYDGIGSVRPAHVPEALVAAEKQGITIFSIYAVVPIDEGTTVDPVLFEALGQLKGRGVALWLGLTSKKFKPADLAGDEFALRRFKEIAAPADDNGVPIILYPHAGFWLERMDDALRFADKTGRADIGVMFNLCHFLRLQDEADLSDVLRRAKSRLRCVSINGADSGCRGAEWKRIIQTLDRGTFDVANVIRALDAIGYAGPVGFQGYGIGGDARDNLERTIGAWRAINARAERAR